MGYAFSQFRRREFSEGVVNDCLWDGLDQREDLESLHLQYMTLLMDL